MESEEKRGDEKSGFDQWVEKGKKMADEAGEFIEDKVEQLKQSDSYRKVNDFVEQKAAEYKSGEMEEKFQSYRESATRSAEEAVDQVKSVTSLLAGDVEELIGKVKNSLKGKEGAPPADQQA